MLITCVALKARETCHVLPRKRRTKHIFFFFRMEFYYKSYCCFGPRHGVLLQPASINHLTATLHILVPYILCFCPQKYYGLPRGRDSQFWQRTLGSTSNTNWTCCRFNPRINLKPDNGPRSWSCSVEWRLRFEKNKIKNRVAEQRANSKFKKIDLGLLGIITGSLYELWLEESRKNMRLHYIGMGSFAYILNTLHRVK